MTLPLKSSATQASTKSFAGGIRSSYFVTLNPSKELFQITQKTVKNDDCSAVIVNKGLLMV